MARIRTIKPEFWTDGDLLKISRDSRLFYVGLWNFADDNGVLEYNLISLKAKIFPMDNINIKKLVTELASINKIIIYSVDDKEYLFLKNLSNHQVIDRPRKSFLPLFNGNQLKSTEISLGREGKGREGSNHETSLKEFFDYYLLKTKKSFRLTDLNKALIEGRLTEGYTVDQLKRAVDNFIQDPWPERKNHLDLIYCIGKQKGKPDNLEKWLNYKPEGVFKQP